MNADDTVRHVLEMYETGSGVFIGWDVPAADWQLALEIFRDQETVLRRVGLLILFFSSLIFLHALAMSEGTDNALDNNVVYGFSPDRVRWSNYAIEFDDTIYFFDTKSVTKRNNNIKVWIKFGEPINDKRGTRIYREAVALKEIDCGARLIRTLEWNYISMSNEQNRFKSPTKWEEIEPETADDALLEAICAQPGKIKKRSSKKNR